MKVASNKNILDGVFLGNTAGAKRDVVLAKSVNDYTGVATDCPIGARITSVYCFVQMISTGTGTANHDWYLMKRPGIITAISTPAPGSIGGDKNRRYVLHEEKGIPGNSSDGAYPLTFKGVIKIPKMYQRMGEDDQIVIVGNSPDAYNMCVKAIYRWKV